MNVHDADGLDFAWNSLATGYTRYAGPPKSDLKSRNFLNPASAAIIGSKVPPEIMVWVHGAVSILLKGI